MPSTRPASVKVIGKTYSITYTNGRPLDDGNLGEMDPDKQTLTVKKGQPLEQEQDTVLHEVMHAIDHELGLSLSEKHVKGMATGLLAVMKDNPRFVTYLRKADK